MKHSTQNQSETAKLIGDIAPKLTEITDEVLYGEIWTRTQLSPRERSLITVSVLTATGRTEQLDYHLHLAIENGMTLEELAEVITHIAFYSGWPSAMSALGRLKTVYSD